MISNKKIHPVITEVFIRGRTSLVLTTQSYFPEPKDVRLNTTNFFIMKITNRQDPQQIATNHSSDIDSKDFTIMQNHIHFWLIIQFFHQIMLYIFQRIY